MKSLLIVPIFTVSLIAMDINFKKKFEIDIKPNELQAHINIVVKKQSEQDVISKLSHYSSYFDASTEVEKKGGNYNIRAEYKYENNHRYRNGYIGTMSYLIKTKDTTKVNIFISALYSQKSDKDVDISTGSVSWIMGKEQGEGQVDKLRLRAIEWAGNYAESLSFKLSKGCTVSNISFDDIRLNYPEPIRANYQEKMMEDSVQSMPSPTQDNQKITINPSIKIECK